MKMIFAIFHLLFIVSPPVAFAAPPEVLSIRGNRHIESFAEAKRVLKQVFEGHNETLYCGCKYYGKELNLNSCGIYVPNAPKRLKKLEWEHVVPAAKFGETIAAWRTGDAKCSARGRKCAEKASPLFRQMEGDLYNLWPESGEINGRRSNKPPTETLGGMDLVGRSRVATFGTCATSVGKHSFAPRPEARGPIARSYLYMTWAYDVALAENDRVLFERWDREYPPSEFECARRARIKRLQGNENPFLEKACAPPAISN